MSICKVGEIKEIRGVLLQKEAPKCVCEGCYFKGVGCPNGVNLSIEDGGSECFGSIWALPPLKPKPTALDRVAELEATIAKASAEAKALREQIAAEAKAKRPELVKGQIWQYKDGETYICHIPNDNDNESLVCVAAPDESGHIVGNSWAGSRGFDGRDHDFTYLGMASDLLAIKGTK